MEQEVVHYYNVIAGECVCGARVEAGRKDFSVFPERVNCPECLEKLTEGKSEAS